ncbi:MAG: hypothetical protein KIT31_25990 [Deltaproteobacteria bacterium]|nr:hypothetical protein [Deltaproteobacteria bacterium]
MEAAVALRARATCPRSRRGVDVINPSTTSHHHPRNARFIAEVIGTTPYTPAHEIRDPYGPIPRLVVRGLATESCVVIPDAPASAESLNTDGIVGV